MGYAALILGGLMAFVSEREVREKAAQRYASNYFFDGKDYPKESVYRAQ